LSRDRQTGAVVTSKLIPDSDYEGSGGIVSHLQSL
jgi:hypothetical protein